MICYKCNGTGYIQGFAHVAQGVCFDCKGSGVRPDKAKSNVGYSKAFAEGFRGGKQDDPYFPAEVQPTTWEVIGMPGHPTAEHRAMFWEGFYYVGQPVCRSSTWYKVPPEQWGEFKKHFNKAYKKAISLA
jgi:hypothetical protein